MTTAAQFMAAFHASFDEARERKAEDWKLIWATNLSWSQFMIWDDESVIRRDIAHKLGLQCYLGEPLHLDAVFHMSSQRHWFPMMIAVEHENNPHRFQEEIDKLLSVRCPLKVGITYTLFSDVGSDKHSRLEHLRSELAQKIRERFATIDAVIKEAPETEYLFLLGCEEEPGYQIRWRQLAFRAGQGPENREFA